MKFILDSMFGTLAKYLRMLGYDTLYIRGEERKKLQDPEILAGRTLITKDRKTKFNAERIMYLPEIYPLIQLAKLKEDFSLKAEHPFTICLECNHPLAQVQKHIVIKKLPPKVIEGFSEFNICPGCGRVYWKGTHYRAMLEKIRNAGFSV